MLAQYRKNKGIRKIYEKINLKIGGIRFFGIYYEDEKRRGAEIK